MTPKKTLGAHNIYQKTYQEMVEEADRKHMEEAQKHVEYVEKVSEANSDPANQNMTLEERKELKRKEAKSLRSAARAALPSLEGTIIAAQGAVMDSSQRVNPVTPQGSERLEQELEIELLKMRRVLVNPESQKFVMENFDFLVTMLKKVVQNYNSPDFNVPYRGNE